MAVLYDTRPHDMAVMVDLPTPTWWSDDPLDKLGITLSNLMIPHS